MSGSTWLRLGAVFGFLAVLCGAFAAHGLEGPPSTVEGSPCSRRPPATRCITPWRWSPSVSSPGHQGRAGHSASRAGRSWRASSCSRAASTSWRLDWGKMAPAQITPFGGVLFLVGWAALAGHRPGPAVPSPET